MNTRTLLIVPYKLYRVPLAVLDQHVAQRLRADSSPRLVFDRALGSYDRLAGHLLNDDDIGEQGSDRIARSGKLAGAVALARDAATQREQAAEAAKSGQQSAAAKREEAQQRLADGLDQAKTTERRGKRHAATQARAQAKSVKQQADARTKQRVSALQQGLQQVDAVTDLKLQQSHGDANAKLEDASATKTTANSASARADQPGQLAATKRNSRTSVTTRPTSRRPRTTHHADDKRRWKKQIEETGQPPRDALGNLDGAS
jgi:hypothetical protein